MKLLAKEYLRSLKERDELDAVLPDLLSQLGYNVISKPAIGVRQYGVDIAAIGTDSDSIEKIFLVSVKAGDLTRRDWDTGEQALRPSINDILDHYIPSWLPKKYANMPIVIVLCFGGDIHQNVQPSVAGYINQHTSKTIEFQIWNGDKLAEMLLSGPLGAEFMPQASRIALRKSIALLDEPDASYSHFCDFVRSLTDAPKQTQKEKIRAAQQINLGLWMLFAWSRDAHNLEAPYRTSEYAVLNLWALGASFIRKSSANAKAMASALDHAIDLHIRISLTYANEVVIPHTGIMHGISAAIQTSDSAEINLRLFDVLGRLSLCGLWVAHIGTVPNLSIEKQKAVDANKTSILDGLTNLVNNNPALKTPLQDQHAVDICMAFLFLTHMGEMKFIRAWVQELVMAAIFSTTTGAAYPCCFTDYQDLIRHPSSKEKEYFERATAGSVLYPTLAYWALVCQHKELIEILTKFATEHLPHTTMQLWFPGRDSEAHMYSNSSNHGIALAPLNITGDCSQMLNQVQEEASKNPYFSKLSAIELNQWPVLLTACRHYRFPIPPNFWPTLNSAEEVGA